MAQLAGITSSSSQNGGSSRMSDADTLSLAMQAVKNNPLTTQHQRPEQAEAALQASIARWKPIYPAVQLLAQENPGIDYRLLTLPWLGRLGEAPLVYLTITPRKLKLPEVSNVLGIAAAFVSLIPVVGQVAAVTLNIINSSMQGETIQKTLDAVTRISGDSFAPSYFPQPFRIIMPLDWAQIAVAQPWLAVYLHQRFVEFWQQVQLGQMQRRLGAPANVLLSPTPQPTVLGVAPAGVPLPLPVTPRPADPLLPGPRQPSALTVGQFAIEPGKMSGGTTALLSTLALVGGAIALALQQEK